MSVINSQPLIGASGNQGVATYDLTRSLRFRRSASAYLNRTPAGAGNRQTFTYSTWIKRGAFGADSAILSAGNNRFVVKFSNGNSDAIRIYEYNGSTFDCELITTAVFRDPSAWYHFVLVADTTQATASNRVKVYINGTQLTSFSTANYPSQNFSLFWNSANANYIGVESGNAHYHDGYLAETNFVDGQALTPADFGETSTTTGVWIPKKYTGTYGTNGFYLDFKDTSSTAALGYDAAGSNDWTVNNVSLTAGTTYDSMTDVPTLTSATAANYCVINAAHPPVVTSGGTYSISNGNLSAAAATATKWMSTVGTFQIPVGSGKWYFEFVPQQNGGDYSYGIGMFNVNNANLTNAVFFDQAGGLGYAHTGSKVTGGTYTSYGASWGVLGDIIGVAIDASGATTSIEFYKNNTSQGVAFSGLTGTYVPAFGNAGANAPFSVNFGQQPFAYTPPSGFVALNTFNLPTPTIGATASTQANKYFDATAYVGTGSTRSVTNSGGFSPDLVWVKARISAQNHQLSDSVRGTGKSLSSNTTGAEVTNEPFGYVSAFNSDGFSVTAGSSGSDYVNLNTWTYVGWQWRASDSAAVTNTAGSITSTVSANTSAGFSIVTYTGTGANATVGHGLGVAPRMIICKNRTTGGASGEWQVLHQAANGGSGHLGAIFLNLTQGWSSGNYFQSTLPTSTVFSLDGSGYANASGNNHIAYCFAEVAGYSKFGSYTGNGSTDGTFVYTGFRPKFILTKVSSTSQGWHICDTSRNPSNVADLVLQPHVSTAEVVNIDYDILSNGFKIRTTDGALNSSGQTYIFAAFAESPFKYANAR